MSIVNPSNLIPPQFRILAYVLIIAAIFGGGYWVGHTFAKNHYTAIIATMKLESEELKRKQAELQTALTVEIANIKERIVTQYIDRIKVVKEKEYVYRDQATNVVPDRTELSNGWVYLHDSSARGIDADPTRSADATGSGVEANQALATVVENYGTCQANAEQIASLQNYAREAKKAVDVANEKIRKINSKK
jgi:hypothetical protein